MPKTVLEKHVLSIPNSEGDIVAIKFIAISPDDGKFFVNVGIGSDDFVINNGDLASIEIAKALFPRYHNYLHIGKL